MVTRSNTRRSPSFNGTITDQSGFVYRPGPVWSREDTRTDVLNERNQDLTIIHSSVANGVINGKHTLNGGLVRTYSNLVPLRFGVPGSSNCVRPSSLSGTPSYAEIGTKVVADTNPSRPHVSIPNFLFELRELPHLLKTEYGPIIKRLSGTNLTWHFGLVPLASDLLSIFDFSGEVEKRRIELLNIKKSGVRRKRNHSIISASSNGGFETMQSLGGTIQYRHSNTSSVRSWGYCEWRATSNFPKTDFEMRARLKTAALGLRINAYTAWEAIPWSWLVDWCSNVGDFLIAGQNFVGAEPGVILAMQETTHETVWYPDSNVKPALPNVVCKKVTKTRRRIAAPSLVAKLPALSAKQLSILGSIAVLRRSPKTD